MRRPISRPWTQIRRAVRARVPCRRRSGDEASWKVGGGGEGDGVGEDRRHARAAWSTVACRATTRAPRFRARGGVNRVVARRRSASEASVLRRADPSRYDRPLVCPAAVPRCGSSAGHPAVCSASNTIRSGRRHPGYCQRRLVRRGQLMATMTSASSRTGRGARLSVRADAPASRALATARRMGPFRDRIEHAHAWGRTWGFVSEPGPSLANSDPTWTPITPAARGAQRRRDSCAADARRRGYRRPP